MLLTMYWKVLSEGGNLLSCLSSLDDSFKEAKLYWNYSRKEVGTEHILYISWRQRYPNNSYFREFVGFSYEDKEESCVLMICGETWNKKSGWTKNDLKAIRSLHKKQSSREQNMANMMGCHPTPEWWSEEDYTRGLDGISSFRSAQAVVGQIRNLSDDSGSQSQDEKNNPVLVGDGVSKTAP